MEWNPEVKSHNVSKTCICPLLSFRVSAALRTLQVPQAAPTPSWGPMWLRLSGCKTAAGSGPCCVDPPAAVLQEAQRSPGSFRCASALPGTLSADSRPSSARCPVRVLEEAVLRMLIEHFLLKGKEKKPNKTLCSMSRALGMEAAASVQGTDDAAVCPCARTGCRTVPTLLAVGAAHHLELQHAVTLSPLR